VANFKIHFLSKQQKLRKHKQTAQQGGYHANFTADVNDNLYLEETASALANLATATASDQEAFTALVANNTNLTQ
jgi:hypothetical protein